MQTEMDNSVCPYFQGSDERCAKRFNLHRMAEIYDQCLGEFGRCSTYHQLRIDRPNHPVDDPVSHAA